MNKMRDIVIFDLLNSEILYDEMFIGFWKKNGEKRIMRATLMPKLIPSSTEKTSEKTVAANPDVQKVYDLDVQGWRSFRWDSFIAWGSKIFVEYEVAAAQK